MSVFIFSSCEDKVEALGASFVTFESNFGDVTVIPGAPLTKTINVYSTNTNGSDRSVNLVVKGNSTIRSSSYTMPNSVTIPANESSASFDIVFVEDGLDIAQDEMLVVAMESSEFNTGEDISLNVAKGCAAKSFKIKVSVTLDAYPEDVVWKIRNNFSGSFMIGRGFNSTFDYAGLTGTINTTVCLPAGEYWFWIWDKNNNGAGPCSISVDGSQIWSTNGDYGQLGLHHVFTAQ